MYAIAFLLKTHVFFILKMFIQRQKTLQKQYSKNTKEGFQKTQTLYKLCLVLALTLPEPLRALHLNIEKRFSIQI